MKKCILYKINWVRMVAMLVTMVGMVSCTDVEFIDGTLEEGIPVTVDFQFAVPTQDLVVSTRAMGDETANKVVNMYVIGFKPNGERAFGFFYDTELNGGKTTILNAKEKIATGTYDIYAVANIDSDVYGVDENTDNLSERNLKSFLDDVSTKDALLTKTVSILTSARNLDRSGSSLLMAGALCDKDGKATSVSITGNGQTVRTINLKRLDSEITFNFKPGENVAFTAKRWYAVNAPAKSRLIEDETEDGANDSGDFFNTYKAKEEDRTPVYDNTFTFYIPENRKKAKNEDIEKYQDREKEIKDSNGKHDIDPDTQRRNYVNAPDYGSYVVVTGHYEGPATSTDASIGSMPHVVAEVQYTIHLGFVKNIANDFFSKRNTKYTYNVTVKGVDNIIIEVEKEEENQPGATGDVIFGNGNNVYTLDAHYETVLLTFDYDELVKAWGDGKIEGLFTAMVSTPYTTKLTTDEAKREDHKWVQVIKNEGASTNFQSYYAVKDKLQSIQAMLDELKDAVTRKDPTKVFSSIKGKLVVTYTCFVDEFYYEKEDLPSGVYTQLPDQTNIWKSFVNCPNRKMYIICNRTYSKDEESSIINSKYVISQRSIQTFYSTEPTPGQKVIAYGIESLNETGNLMVNGYIENSHADNGWENSKRLLEKVACTWADVYYKLNGYKDLEMNKRVNKYGNLNPDDADYNISNYLLAMKRIFPLNQSFSQSCLQRNRCEASGTNVDERDLKWYLPTINQYQSFYLGEPALSQESRLFEYPAYSQITNTSTQFIKHYGASNYGTGGKGGADVFVFWAEEATSVSTLKQQVEWATTGGSKNNPEAYFLRLEALSYRCVRNLGSDGADKGGVYTLYRTIIEKPAERVEIKVDKLNPLLRSRGRATGELGPHFYQDKGNHFYTEGFEVASADACKNLSTTLERATGVDTQGGTGCEALNKNLQPGEAKWRVPNLRELTLMWQEGVINEPNSQLKGRAASRTQMSYKYSGNKWYRKGWTVTDPINKGIPNLGMSSNDNHSTTVRCVRDLK